MYSKVLMILTVTSLGLFLLFDVNDVDGRGCGGRGRRGGCGAGRAGLFHGGFLHRGGHGTCEGGSCAMPGAEAVPAPTKTPPLKKKVEHNHDVSTGCACPATGECSCGSDCQCGAAAKR